MGLVWLGLQFDMLVFDTRGTFHTVVSRRDDPSLRWSDPDCHLWSHWRTCPQSRPAPYASRPTTVHRMDDRDSDSRCSHHRRRQSSQIPQSMEHQQPSHAPVQGHGLRSSERHTLCPLAPCGQVGCGTPGPHNRRPAQRVQPVPILAHSPRTDRTRPLSALLPSPRPQIMFNQHLIPICFLRVQHHCDFRRPHLFRPKLTLDTPSCSSREPSLTTPPTPSPTLKLTPPPPSQIALGTIILLAGVLCLSWRLNTDPTTRPPVAQNPLTPGMGFVDDESDSSAETALLPPRSPDAESAISSKSEGGESSPFLPAQRRYRHRTRFSTTTTPRTPTSKNNDLLATTSRLRRAGPTESEEIWDELEDETFSPPLDRGGGTNSPSSPYYTPQQQQQQQQRRTFSTPQQSKRNSRVLFSNPPSQSTPDLHPSSNNPNPNPNPNPNTTSQNADTEDPPGEHTPLLLARSSTGRSYRANQRRRRSAPMLSIDTESAARGGGGGHRRLSEGGSERAQEAVGGWWRMRRGWWGGDDRGGDRGGGGREGGSRRGGKREKGKGKGKGKGKEGKGKGRDSSSRDGDGGGDGGDRRGT